MLLLVPEMCWVPPGLQLAAGTGASQAMATGHRESEALGRHHPHHPRLWCTCGRPEPALCRGTAGGGEEPAPQLSMAGTMVMKRLGM